MANDTFKTLAHPIPVGKQLLERSARGADQGDVARLQVDDLRVERVGDRGADGAAGLIGRAEHEVVDEQLRAPVEELGQGLGAVGGLEAVLLLDRHPGELPPFAGKLVVAARELLLLLEQCVALGLPFLVGSNPVLGH